MSAAASCARTPLRFWRRVRLDLAMMESFTLRFKEIAA